MNRYAYETAGKRLWRMLKPEAQRMRHAPTPAELALWQRLRGGKLGVRSRRQHAIDRFIVDFVCLPAKLIVEMDGGIHEAQAGQDAERDTILRNEGFIVVRYTNDQVLNSMESVISDIGEHLRERA